MDDTLVSIKVVNTRHIFGLKCDTGHMCSSDLLNIIIAELLASQQI